MKNIPKGTYTVTVRLLGYQTKKEKIEFTNDSIENYSTTLREDYGSLVEVVFSVS
ncbi:carboxypeptidase-like regulatory domain-containing protein [Gillisia sp. CAL575]|uniref:carboxypeptidase-like regulatory domain-containing protein n=1 Tax=Gillisia sp. CAL575 TaxID=985255 RepID=UPI0003A0EB6D|nr:carboxypeptidase-like regulatory domain-containing protein [Gillisia sp. CAL575]